MTSAPKITRQLLCVVIPVALSGIGVIAAPTLELRITAAHLVTVNPEYVGPGAYFRTARKSKNSSPTLNALLPIIKDLPPDTNISWNSLQKVNSMWVPSMIKGDVPLCAVIESKGSPIQHAFLDTTNLPSKCPVKKGNYTVKDFYIKTDGLPATIPGSDWKTYSSWGNRKTNIFTFTLENKVLRKDGRISGGSEAPLLYAIAG